MGVTAMFDIALVKLDEWSNGPQKSTVMSRMYGCVRLVSMRDMHAFANGRWPAMMALMAHFESGS